METQVGIAAAAVTLPAQKRDTRSLFQEESATFNPAIAARLGIEEVPICNGESASAMALSACQQALPGDFQRPDRIIGAGIPGQNRSRHGVEGGEATPKVPADFGKTAAGKDNIF